MRKRLLFTTILLTAVLAAGAGLVGLRAALVATPAPLSMSSHSPAPGDQVAASHDADGSRAEKLGIERTQPPVATLPAPAATGGTAGGTPVALVSIPRLHIQSAPVFDRGRDPHGNMLIARGYAITHYADSAAIGQGNAVFYGHDDIEGNIFAELKMLQPGDQVLVAVPGGPTQAYRVTDKRIVAPTAVQILAPTGDIRLTVFTCWPNLVDTQRVVITAVPA